MDTNIRRLHEFDLNRSSQSLQSLAAEIREVTFSGAEPLSFEQPIVPLTFRKSADDLFSSPAVNLLFEVDGQTNRPSSTFDMAEQTRLHFKSSRSLFVEWIVG